MAFREQEFSELCGVCKAPAGAACLRCGMPLCPEHQHGEPDRCPACEAAFDKLARRRQGPPLRRSSLVMLLSGTVLIGGLALTWGAWILGLAGLGLGSLFLFSDVPARLLEQRRPTEDERVLLRVRFLKQRKPAARLPPPTQSPD